MSFWPGLLSLELSNQKKPQKTVDVCSFNLKQDLMLVHARAIEHTRKWPSGQPGQYLQCHRRTGDKHAIQRLGILAYSAPLFPRWHCYIFSRI